MNCPLCQQIFISQDELMIHVNVCLDTSEASRLMQSSNFVQTTLTTAAVGASNSTRTTNRARKTTNPKNPCPICGKLTTATHVKNCQKKHGVLPRQTVDLMRQYQPSTPPNPTVTATAATAMVAIARSEVEGNTVGNAVALNGCAFESLSILPMATANDLSNNQNSIISRQLPTETVQVHNQENRTSFNPIESKIVIEPEVKMVKQGRQTKLRVTKRKQTTSTPDKVQGDDKCLVTSPKGSKGGQEENKTRYVITLKKQPNPMRSPKLDGLLLRNFKESLEDEEKIPKLWRMSTMLGSPDDFVCSGFEEFIDPPTLKSQMSGFFML